MIAKHIFDAIVKLAGTHDHNYIIIETSPKELLTTIRTALASLESSEREVLERFVRWQQQNDSIPLGFSVLDQYLALKQSKTGRTCSDCGTYYVSKCNPMG